MSSQQPTFQHALSRLIEIPSVSSTLPDLDMSNLPVINELAAWLEAMGFQCEIQPLPGAPHKANLIATLGSGPGGLVLAGHTDTVPYNDSLWKSSPFALEERDGRFYGLGVCDMKGFFALVMEAVRGYLGTPLTAPLIILATADEESSMNGARALAELGRPKARYAVVGEPTGMRPIHMHKGIMMERIQILGQSGHSSNPALGRNAMETAHKVITDLMQFRAELAERYQNPGFTIPTPTLNLGCIHGGDNPNRICGQCQLDFDIRMLPGMDSEQLRQQIRQRLLPIAEADQVEISLEAITPAIEAFAGPENSDLVTACEKLTGHQAEVAAFATEAPFFSRLGMDTVVLGPGDIDQAHQPDEYLSQDRIKPMVAILQSLIRQYCLS
ncbi:acetylornithine deacetylase [Endozoicomonas sp. GU-1]|uniref:acetylornithine deacetylase n=1 Tax=Endozoicomonas sp. GU-1 TaxID=3009078 RepID=UPI0022B3E59F|nr:acetylornithine deacetylase [Endozoicomonas sp. GU-1]WBA82449.1 acetylornithine deacetylase [Endozoicomonas sp. GU-1]WBA85382.1 acetylornithine deacetylase [Endozoicomonas sp. GU-1]